MEAVVKYRLLHWYEPTKDRLGNAIVVRREASHGMRIHTEDGENTPTDIYNVPESEFKHIQTVPGALFSDAELEAAEVLDVDDVEVDSTSPLGTPDGRTAGAHPLSFAEMHETQLTAYLASNPSVDSLINAINNAETQRQSVELGNRLISASIEADYAHHDELVQVVAAQAGIALGVEESDEDTDGPGGAVGVEEPDGSSVDATEAARELALAEDVDLTQVTGTGADGRITQHDVQHYLNNQA